MTFRNSKCKVKQLCDVERAVSGKIYEAGTVYIQVSARKRTGLEQFKILREPGPIESKYAVFLPRTKTEPEYLRITLERSVSAFLEKYVGTNINIQVQTLGEMEFFYHPSLNAQKEIVKVVKECEKQEELEKEMVESLKELKRKMLKEMFV